MSVRGPALRNTDLRSRHAHMRLAVAHAATIPPRRTAPTRRGRHRPRWAAGRAGRLRGRPSSVKAAAHRLRRRPCGPAWTPETTAAPRAGNRGQAQACPAARPGQRRPHAPIPPESPPPGGQADRAQKHPPKRTLSDQPPRDLQELDRAVSYEESWRKMTARTVDSGGLFPGCRAVDQTACNHSTDTCPFSSTVKSV